MQVQSHGEATSTESVYDQRSDSYSFAPGLPHPKSILEKRKGRLSPASSPHKLGKFGPKRRRTVTVKKLFQDKSMPQATYAGHMPLPLELTSFTESSDEKKERASLQSKLFMHSIQKHVYHSETDMQWVHK